MAPVSCAASLPVPVCAAAACAPAIVSTMRRGEP
ncbi:hypothetical protein TNCV_3662661, partial [Trichonephila clavipes]